MPFGNFMTDHNTTLSQVASLFRMNLRSPYTDTILADSDVPIIDIDSNSNMMAKAVEGQGKAGGGEERRAGGGMSLRSLICY